MDLVGELEGLHLVTCIIAVISTERGVMRNPTGEMNLLGAGATPDTGITQLEPPTGTRPHHELGKLMMYL